MQGIRNILVGVDLSHADRLVASELNPPTAEAVRSAVWLAGQVSAELTFFSVLDIPRQADEPPAEDAQQAAQTVRDDTNQVLCELVARARQEGVEAKSRLTFGRDWVEIIRQVLRDSHDMVIVGTRDRGDTDRLLIGGTGMKLLRKCPCPVWVTRPSPALPDGLALPDGRPQPDLSGGSEAETVQDAPTPNVDDRDSDEVMMLVATDLSEVGEGVLHMAVNGAQLLDAKVHLLHAVESSFERRVSSNGLPEEERGAFREQQRTQAEGMVYEQLSQTDWRTLLYGVLTHVVDGPADAAILKAVEEFGVDLLVMGTVAGQETPGLLFGDTAERVLPELTCSVLAIKPDDFQCPITLD